VLREAGYDEGAIRQLRASGAVGVNGLEHLRALIIVEQYPADRGKTDDDRGRDPPIR